MQNNYLPPPNAVRVNIINNWKLHDLFLPRYKAETFSALPSNSPYTAISHVWGPTRSIPPYLTTAPEGVNWEIPLKISKHRWFPKFIKNLNEPVWVDVYSINQENGGDTAQVKLMKEVYAGAKRVIAILELEEFENNLPEILSVIQKRWWDLWRYNVVEMLIILLLWNLFLNGILVYFLSLRLHGSSYRVWIGIAAMDWLIYWIYEYFFEEYEFDYLPLICKVYELLIPTHMFNVGITWSVIILILIYVLYEILSMHGEAHQKWVSQLIKVMNNPWWSRVWTFQEAVLARKLELWIKIDLIGNPNHDAPEYFCDFEDLAECSSSLKLVKSHLNLFMELVTLATANFLFGRSLTMLGRTFIYRTIPNREMNLGIPVETRIDRLHQCRRIFRSPLSIHEKERLLVQEIFRDHRSCYFQHDRVYGMLGLLNNIPNISYDEQESPSSLLVGDLTRRMLKEHHVLIALPSHTSRKELWNGDISNNSQNDLFVIYENVQFKEIDGGFAFPLLQCSLEDIAFPGARPVNVVHNAGAFASCVNHIRKHEGGRILAFEMHSNQWTDFDSSRLEKEIIIVGRRSTFGTLNEERPEEWRILYTHKNAVLGVSRTDQSRNLVAGYIAIWSGYSFSVFKMVNCFLTMTEMQIFKVYIGSAVGTVLVNTRKADLEDQFTLKLALPEKLDNGIVDVILVAVRNESRAIAIGTGYFCGIKRIQRTKDYFLIL
ncbi:hypothetical protein HK098_001629 [Nowakowskiella sp. JEL0407]|nr:hypothetical protein HK098_001629 [Nowakowskiella sp. JEL0407]